MKCNMLFPEVSVWWQARSVRALDDHGAVAVLPLGEFTALGSAGARLTTDP